MKKSNYILFLFLFSFVYTVEKGYYIYQFFIHHDSQISFHSSKYINEKLKISKIKEYNHHAFDYKLIDSKKILYLKDQ